MKSNYCPFCNGDIEPNADGKEECVLCGTTFRKVSDEEAKSIAEQTEAKRLNKLHKEVWGQ